jgi:uncharacterized protein (DUF1778 family)
MVRLDDESKALLASAAELRKISVSDYVRSIVVGQARREVAAAGTNVISMTPEERKLRDRALFQGLTIPSVAEITTGTIGLGVTQG